MREARWIRSAKSDVAVALCWLPFVVTAHLLEHDKHLLNLFATGVLLLSFSHQPLTLALVYGDPDQFALRRAIFTWSPLIFVGAIALGLWWSLAAVAAVAGLWNAEHTLMQRYGLTRIYGRKAGDDQGAIERAMLISFLVLALVWVGADPRTPGFLARLDLGGVNHDGVQFLHRLHGVALALVVPAVVVTIALVARWLRAERALGATANPAKHLYLASTAALFAVILIDPIAGLMGYVGAHALEYFVVVHHTLGGPRYRGGRAGGAVGRAVRLPSGRIGFFVAYGAAIGALVIGLDHVRWAPLASIVLLTLGGLHVFYDGFIWKLRRPAVAQGFTLPAKVLTTT